MECGLRKSASGCESKSLQVKHASCPFVWSVKTDVLTNLKWLYLQVFERVIIATSAETDFLFQL